MHELIGHKIQNYSSFEMHELVDYKFPNYSSYNVRRCIKCGVIVIERGLNADIGLDWYWNEDEGGVWRPDEPDCQRRRMKRALT